MFNGTLSVCGCVCVCMCVGVGVGVQYGYLLIAQGRCEQASSVFQQTLRVAKEVLGPRHIKIINYQVCWHRYGNVYRARSARKGEEVCT